MSRKHAEEAAYLAQLRQQQAIDRAPESKPKPSSIADTIVAAVPKPKAMKRYSDDDSTSDTSSVDTHLDECDICDDGGDLVCCDGCEKAYHPECLKVDGGTLPDVWYGPCCENRSPTKGATPKSTRAQAPQSVDDGLKVNTGHGMPVHLPKRSKTKGNMEKTLNISCMPKQQQQMRIPAAQSTNANYGQSEKAITTHHIAEVYIAGTKAVSQSKEISPIVRKLPHASSASVVHNVPAQQACAPVPPAAKKQSKAVVETMIQQGVKVQSNVAHPAPSQPSAQSKQPRHVGKAFLPQNNESAIHSKRGTFRTVVVPQGVVEGSIFHVLMEGGRKMGVVCPVGVKAGQAMIVMEPGCYSPPIAPEKIVEMNEARLVQGFEKEEGKYARRAFWEVLYPQIKAAGWFCKRETNYNFGAYTFTYMTGESPGDSCETIADVLKSLAANDTYKEALHEYYTFIEKQKEAKRMEERKRNRLQDEMNASPEKKVRVGSEYQVRSLPRVGSYEPGESSDYIQRQLWSKDQDSDPPSDLYNVNESKEWKEWAKYPTLMDQFHQAIIECNKELSSVASAIGRSVGFCLWYYYTKYKPSGNYKVLKARLKQMESEQSKNNDECMICDDGGELLCCDTCPNAFHPACLGLASAALSNEEKWSCPSCVRNRTDRCRSPIKSPKKAHNAVGPASPRKPGNLFAETSSTIYTQPSNIPAVMYKPPLNMPPNPSLSHSVHDERKN